MVQGRHNMSYTPLPLCVLRKPIQPEHIRRGQTTLPRHSLPRPKPHSWSRGCCYRVGLFGKTTVKHKKAWAKASHRKPPPILTSNQNIYCGSHLLSHTHQDAVPSTPQGLAHQVRKGYWAFPPSYHHRKTTKQQPTPQKRGQLVVPKLYSERKQTTIV